MLSVILYGRNDSHGYNLHKRAALSLNCIAEMLSDSDDEIVFVDYNTPNDLPTFIEAIYDTLTPKLKRLLRVLRVRPEVHALIGRRSHLAALEPHARNIAIRRSNPRNRWVLFTNTDMIFVSRENQGTLSTAVSDLSDGQYIVPRFELPEPLWESLPRSDPKTVMHACRELGRQLHLDEITAAHPFMRFDQPGDFQLVPRTTLFEIRGFDERMIHGWHADSNMCKRLFLYYGNRTESLAARLKGYHCDHTRVATGTHRQDIKLENDLYEFVYLVKDPVVRGQEETWGAPKVDIEEVDFCHGVQARFIPVLRNVLAAPQGQEYYSDSNDLRNFVSYTAEHVLPYVAGNLTVYPPSARFVYAGNHERMLHLLSTCIRDMGFERQLSHVPELLVEAGEDTGSTPLSESAPGKRADALMDYDLVIFDLGLDSKSAGRHDPQRVTDFPRPHRYSIGRVARLIREFAERSDELARHGKAAPDVLVINANHHIPNQFVSRFLLAVTTPYTTRTRKGRARVGNEKLYRSAAWKNIEDQMRTWFGYGEEEYLPAPAEPGLVIDLTAAGHASLYKDGHWGAIDPWGCWTDGPWVEIVFPAPRIFSGDLLAFIKVAAVYEGLDKEPIRLSASFEGEPVGRWVASPGYALVTLRILLPARLVNGKEECRLRIEIENPQSVQAIIDATGQFRIGEDPQQLGVRVQSVGFASTDSLRLPLDREIDFTEKGTGANYMAEFWSQPDNLGAWSVGRECQLMFVLDDPPAEGAIARFTITDVAVNEQYQHLNVLVSINGKELAQWVLGPLRVTQEISVFVPPEFISQSTPTKITFGIDSPRSPHELGWGDGDLRPLGFRLTRFRLDNYRTPRLKLGEAVDFTSGGNGAELLRDDWGAADRFGSWTMGPESTIHMKLQDVPPGPVPVAVVISDCMVSGVQPHLPVSVKANGRRVADWIFGPDRKPHLRSFQLPEGILGDAGELVLKFEVADPRSPLALGWSGDTRPLGIRLARALFGSVQLEIPEFGGLGAPTGMLRNLRQIARKTAATLRIAAGGA